jgi:hypothetical protein
LCEHEQVGRHTPVDPTVLQVPDVADYGWPEQDEWEIRIKHKGAHTSIFYRNNPMNVVGWKGDLFPYKLNVRDIRPIMSDRIHLAPSSWVTFEGTGFVVLSFLPQIAVADLSVEELPSCHRNIDMDEVMLTHADDDPQGRRPAASRSRRRASCTAPMRRNVPNSRPSALRAHGGRAPASESTPIGRWTSRPSLPESPGDARPYSDDQDGQVLPLGWWRGRGLPEQS